MFCSTSYIQNEELGSKQHLEAKLSKFMKNSLDQSTEGIGKSTDGAQSTECIISRLMMFSKLKSVLLS